MENKNIKLDPKKIRNDILLILAILIIFVVPLSIFLVFGKEGDCAEVLVDGESVGVYSLSKNTVVDIATEKGGINRLEIKEHSAKIIYANCPDGICSKHRKINKTNETIVCLPHKVVVKIVSKNNEVDITT